MLIIQHPAPYQVIQRKHFQGRHSNSSYPGGPRMGGAVVRIAGTFQSPFSGTMEARNLPFDSGSADPREWIQLPFRMGEDRDFVAEWELPAGGWYRLEIRLVDTGQVLFETAVSPFGIGEVFLIAGQSYAENANEQPTTIDPGCLVTAMDPTTKQWRIAHDPQPYVTDKPRPARKANGTIWPSAMNLLQPLLKVPVGMVNVAVGGTASRQWIPGEELFLHFANAGSSAGDFRYVLWQQGESDVIENIDSELYKSRILHIKKELEQIWGFSKPWIIAKSTIHPVVYVKHEQEHQIRHAIDELWETPGCLPGPDTDLLDTVEVYRATREQGGHFTLLGQQKAGLLWFSSLWSHLHK